MADDDLLVRIGLTEKQYLASLKRIEAQSVRAAKGVDKSFAAQNKNFVRSAARADKAAKGFANGGLKQIGMQLSQVAQQGAATGNYLQAMSIQAADIGLAFGGMGIAIGAALTVLTPLAMEMLATGDAGRDLEQVFEDLGDAMANLEKARAGAARGRADLTQEYSALAVQAEKLFAIERQIAEQRAAAAVQDATRSVVKGLGTGTALGLDPEQIRLGEVAVTGLTDKVLDLQQALIDASDDESVALDRVIERLLAEAGALEDVTVEIDQLGKTLGISSDAAREVAARFAEISAMDPGREQADAFADLTSYIWETSDGLVDATDEGEALYDRLREAVLAALDLAKTDMASPIGAAADEGARLASNLATAVAMFNEIARRESKVYSGRGGDPRRFAEGGADSGDNYRANVDYTPIDDIIARHTKTAGKGGGGGGKSALKETQEYARLAQQYIEGTRSALERHNAELALLEDLNARGFFAEHPEAYARAVAQVEEEFNRETFDAYREGVEGFTDALFEGGDALKDWARGAVIELAKVATQMMILRALGLPTGGVMGGSWLGRIFAGFFDQGGTIPSGQFGIAGENGPEIVKGPAQVTSTADTARMMQGGATDVRVYVDDDGKLNAVVDRRTKMAISRAAPGIVRQSVSATYASAREEPIG